MEESTLNFYNLSNILNEFINDFMNTYKSLLIRDGKKSSGNLIDSIKAYDIKFEDNEIVVNISLASYWKYVEYGRKPGRFPPLQAIFKWVDQKPVMPRPINGLKPPTRKQLSFLVARKIAKEGIKAGNQFQEALDIVWARWNKQISNAISDDIQLAINEM